MNTMFVIFNVTELDKVDFNQVMETSIGTIRKSIDGTKTFVKWEENNEPSFIEDLQTKEGPYKYEEIKAILSTKEWTKKMFIPSLIEEISLEEEL